MRQEEVVAKIKSEYKNISLEPADNYYWSPSENKVFYVLNNNSIEAVWALLHEVGHALLDHTKYFSDIELVKIEVEAWNKAEELASDLDIEIDEDHIQDCLDSYRDWLHKRSLCPDCDLSGVQVNTKTYVCIFCHKRWSVTSERFCRPYRLQNK